MIAECHTCVMRTDKMVSLNLPKKKKSLTICQWQNEPSHNFLSKLQLLRRFEKDAPVSLFSFPLTITSKNLSILSIGSGHFHHTLRSCTH